MIQTMAVAVKTTPAIRRLIAQVEQGYTIRCGTYAPRRGFPRWEWQLYDAAGEMVRPVTRKERNALDDAGYGHAIHGFMSELKGKTRWQEAK